MNANDPAVQLRIRMALQTLERIPVGLPADALVRQVDSLVGDPTSPIEGEELLTFLVRKRWVYTLTDAIGRTLYRLSSAGREALAEV